MQATVKSFFFATVHMQLEFPGGAPLYLFQLGTDLLENLFSVIRSLSPGTNVTFQQLCQRIDIADKITQIRSNHSEWDGGPRRLQATADHVNPRCVPCLERTLKNCLINETG